VFNAADTADPKGKLSRQEWAAYIKKAEPKLEFNKV